MIKLLVGMVIFSFSVVEINAGACSKKYFTNAGFGPPLPSEDIISNYSVNFRGACFIFCMQEEACVGFNYRERQNENEENCQLSNKTLNMTFNGGKWIFYQDPQVIVTTQAYCGDPGTPFRGYTKGLSYTYGSTVTFHCTNQADTLQGASSAECLSDSSWSNSLPKCVHPYLRLKGSDQSNRGRIEIHRSGYGWYTFCDHSWDMNEAKVVCRELGYSGAKAVRYNSYYGKGYTGSPVIDNHPNCKGSELSILNCPRYYSFYRTNCGTHNDDVGIECI